MTTLHFIYRKDKTNAGDWNACPLRYFREVFTGFKTVEHDVEAVNYKLMRRNDVFIFGGGGMIDLSEKYNRIINNLLSQKLRVIGWGFGVNHTAKIPFFKRLNFLFLRFWACATPSVRRKHYIVRVRPLCALPPESRGKGSGRYIISLIRWPG